MMKNSPIIIALDFPDKKSTDHFISQITPELGALKIGKNLFTQYGPDYVRELIQKGFKVFLDLKFHDIPKTVFDACTAAAELGVWMVNAHVAGGVAMMCAARDAINAFPAASRPLLIGVTVLTSLDESDLRLLGIHDSIENTVLRFAHVAKECKLDGVVCSAKEALLLRKELGKDFLLVTPGIRLEFDSNADQKRVATPRIALNNGANYLVIGRSITHAKDPVAVLKQLLHENVC
ncbi:MAG: orotidine 5'-phosphate decarboxylase [Gammaproteobacteria bacterium RIFCSPHIGHO2_02_FULL_39_13]|nr:MAG: orotidine 5'-phosphate decarboxylase [Gammaproteobacteria bacterium RIFCSPHIGHO2_02_FULL_39_13]OGT49361.1 MAG: orotidine 5'-phosphate decarboxylase [Gammaproteobacteria bacterium RIFCSPHIGHO2_12_FULL_39_24]